MGSGRHSTAQDRNKVRYAVVGLGHIAQVAILPAFRHAANSELVAVVSGDPVKRKELSKRYKARIAVDYRGYDELLASGSVDAVYLALPNDLHRDFALPAAKAGVHILCEKPLAATEKDALAMVTAARQASVRLMTAYRLHFDSANLEALRLVQTGKIGDPRVFNSTFTMQVKDDNIRVREARGGGPLFDIGVYCINAARSLFKDEPTEVTALAVTSGERRFREIDQSVSVALKFPHARLAGFVVSFGAADLGRYEIVGTRGSLELSPAYEYAEGLTQIIHQNGRQEKRHYQKHDQFAAELVYFSRCVLSGKDPEPSGWEGAADVRIIQAVERSLKTGRSVTLAPFRNPQHPSPAQKIVRPPGPKPRPLHASAPHPE
ncbi:MAG TPA: Gfo/Idh/MocA family oxidoreductase [Planctomycetota bacterium]|nr:Gfo/Idh/MocA family oxidoreductase [Planctomycetota bacterium]